MVAIVIGGAPAALAGTIDACGSNGNGQADVPGGDSFTTVAGGELHSLALLQGERRVPGCLILGGGSFSKVC
jgi:hypothetical protein